MSALAADLEGLKTWLGVISTENDSRLQQALDAALAWVTPRVYPEDQDPATRHDDVTTAILMLASRLYSRRSSPEGASGWNELGVVRTTTDSDILALLRFHFDYGTTMAGLA